MTYRNAPIHPILRLIYALLRFTSWVGMSVFYRRRLVLGREHLRFDGPAIVVSNHPSTLMDPLNVGISIRQEMFFLANYSLFKNRVSNWILSRLFCIPVKRKEDVEEGEARDNDAAFEMSFRHLEKNGLLFVAAEGVSWMNRFVRPFKTGTARIAFGAERRNDWNLGVKIIPVGLSYDAPNLFRSRMTVEYGAPIDPRLWAAADADNHEKAVDDFTAEIEKRVRMLTLDAGSVEGEAFLNQVELLIGHAAWFDSEREGYFFLKNFLAKNLDNEGLKTRTAHYTAALQKAGLTDAGLSSAQKIKRGAPSPIVHSSSFIVLSRIVHSSSFIVLLVGYGFWFLPCWLPWLLAKRLKLYVGYDSNVKMLAGLFTFPLALWGGWELAFWLFGSSLLAWAALAALAALGYFAEWYLDKARLWRECRAARFFQKENPAEWEKLCAKRAEIMRQINRLDAG
ncbi:MAG: 1-acyl-sn-glycerol-3-phosphate acyltransferase [Saprospiraceae bacterium]